MTKVVLFCGGEGTRIRESSENLPKPLIKVGNYPLIFYVMQQYAKAKHTYFILAAGYRIEKILQFKEDLENGEYDNIAISINLCTAPSRWKIEVVDTGSACIGERIYLLKDRLIDDKYFYANYSDVISDMDVNISREIMLSKDAICTFSAVKPSQSYHWVDFDTNGNIKGPLRSVSDLDHWINGGFMCMTPEIFNYIVQGEELVLEPFTRLIKINKLQSYKFNGYWKSIDTYKDLLEANNDIAMKKFII